MERGCQAPGTPRSGDFPARMFVHGAATFLPEVKTTSGLWLVTPSQAVPRRRIFSSLLAKPVAAACHAVPDPPSPNPAQPARGSPAFAESGGKIHSNQRTALNTTREKVGNQQDGFFIRGLLFIPQTLTKHLLCAWPCALCLCPGDSKEQREEGMLSTAYLLDRGAENRKQCVHQSSQEGQCPEFRPTVQKGSPWASPSSLPSLNAEA